MAALTRTTDTNLLASLLEVYDLMGTSRTTIRPKQGWSCADFTWIVSIDTRGRASVTEAHESDDDTIAAWWNDPETQPVPLQFKNDTGPWHSLKSRFACTKLSDLMPSRDKDGNAMPAKGLAMFDHVFEHVTSDEAVPVIEAVRKALSNPDMWDEATLKMAKDERDRCACVKVRTKLGSKRAKYVYLHKIDEFAKAWDETYAEDTAAYVANIEAKKTHKGGYVDVATGQVATPIETQFHTKSFLVNGGVPTPVISFNDAKSKAFASYGFSGLDHGGISLDTDAKICTAIDWLTNSRRYCELDPKHKGARLFFYGEGVTEKVVANLRALISCGSDIDVNAESLKDIAGDIIVIEVAPNLARMSVHRIDRCRVRELVERRLEWERHFALHNVKPFNLGRSLYHWDEFDGHERTGYLCESLIKAIVFGETMQPGILRALASIVEHDRAFCSKDSSRASMGRRAALMKAYLIEQCGLDIKEYLMPENDNAMYKLGRMVAVCDKAQRQSVDHKDMRGRLLSPAAEFPRHTAIDIMYAYTRYSSILAKKKPGLAVYLDKIWCEIVRSDETDIDAMFPEMASDEDKLQLYLGYYQQMDAFFTSSSTTQDASDEDFDNDSEEE